jgi:tetratricopeptide (TPR) repeat protein
MITTHEKHVYFPFSPRWIMILSATAWTQNQNITTPRTPSPGAEVSQTIGISKVTVNYSRPSVKGRAIWGELVPYGWNVEPGGTPHQTPWRAGANENTVIEFSHAAKIEGQSVPAGRYGLFFVINSDNSGEVVLSKDSHSWGNFFYDPANDFLRAKIQIREHAMTELLTYEFINLTKNTGELALNWEKKQFPVKIEFAVDDIVMANAAEQLKGAMGFTWQGYSSAANYSLQNKVNTDQGLQWADRAVTMNKSFVTLNTKAGFLRLQGKTEEADMLQAEALTLANEVELNAYGYQLLNQGKMDEAIKVFKDVTTKYPESANAWDSLGEGYAIKGDKENAIKSFKKSLSLNPTEATKANSVKYLKQLGEMK